MRTVDVPGAMHLVRPANVRALDPAPVMFGAMLEGWSRQQRSRLLAEKTVRDRLRLVRRFAEYANTYPWQWTPEDAAERTTSAHDEGKYPVTKTKGVRWNLRKLMATQDMFQTTELVPLLAERGVHLSREQVYRLVTQSPQRLSMDTLAALCDILACTPNDLIEVVEVRQQVA